MNGPAPRLRAKVTRSRNGCLACRQRHRKVGCEQLWAALLPQTKANAKNKKCDEARPHCWTCVRLDLQCPGYTPVFAFRDATKSINRRSAVVESRKSATREPDGNKQKEQQLERIGHGAGPSQASLATDATILEPISIGSSMIPAPTLIHQPGEVSIEAGRAYNLPNIGDQPGSCDRRGPVTRPGLSKLSSAGGESRLGNPTPSSTLNNNHDAGCQNWDNTPTGYLVLPNYGEHPQSGAGLSTDFGTPTIFAPPTSPLTFHFREHDVPDHWLSENFPTQLPSIYLDIWEGVGYANLALKRALLAFDSLTRIKDISAKNDRSQCLELYSLALQAMSGKLAAPLHVTQVLVTILILTIFLHIEAKIGSFSGGLVHCRQADSLIAQHINQLVLWHTARRVLEIWVPIKSWYSLQCLPWSPMSQPFPDTTRAPVFKIFQTTQHHHSLIYSLLCESKNTYIRLILVRLFGPSSSWPSHRPWSQQFEAFLGTPIGRGGISALGVEEDLLISLDRLREELNVWHDSLDVLDLPLPSATAQTEGVHRGRLSPPSAESLLFQSHTAAANYLRYATAQAICSRAALDFATGGDLEGGSYVNPWIIQILQIISGLDVDLFLRDDLLHIGLEWIIYVLLFCSFQQEVMDAVAEHFHWLEKVASAPGSTLPPWALSGLMSRLRRERIQGRVVLFFVTDIKPTEERWTVGSTSIKHSVMIMGRVTLTGASFYDVYCS